MTPLYSPRPQIKTRQKRSWRDWLELGTLAAALSIILLGGCASAPGGMQRELRAVDSATNAVTQVARIVAPALPEPWAGLVTVSAGVVVSGLVLLQQHLRRRVQTLEAGHEELRSLSLPSPKISGHTDMPGTPLAPSGQ